jgi:hypothetical protein
MELHVVTGVVVTPCEVLALGAAVVERRVAAPADALVGGEAAAVVVVSWGW